MDYSQVSSFLACPERYRLSYVEGLRKIQEDKWAAARLFGSGIHAGLEAYYLKKSPQEVGQAFLAVYPAIVDPQEMCRTPVNGLKLLQAYRAYWAAQDEKWNILQVEQVDKLDMGVDGEEPWLVKRDMVIEDKQTGIWGVEHKTTEKYLGELYWRQFEPNSQVTGAVWAIKKKYGQCSGIIVNAIKVGFRQRVYKGEAAGFHWQFERQIFNRSEDQIQDWLLRNKQTIKRIRKLTEDKEPVWEKNEQMCGYCGFRELCMAVGDEQVRETLYEKCDPYEYLSKGGQLDG